MALLSGHAADVYVISGTGTPMTAEACSSVTSTVYQITNAAKRILDMSATWLVYISAVLQTSGYTINYANGKIIFASAPGGAVTISGKYLTATAAGQATGWTIDVQQRLVPSHVFSDTWEKNTCVMSAAKITIKRFAADAYYFTNATSWLYWVLYDSLSDGTAWRAVTLLESMAVSADVQQLIMENLSLTATGPIDYQ